MSVSTTTTATYELVKYSRAYGHTAGNTQSDQATAELQWQHFVNPVIKLTMDTRKSAEGHLESFRLRIVWTFSAGPHAMDVDQREVGFEDLDLVTYSSVSATQSSQGIPLKAVYQGATVGLRYQHPRSSGLGTAPQYRRFQTVFQSDTSAAAFIESIRFICPCKMNAPPARITRPPTTQNKSLPGSASHGPHTRAPLEYRVQPPSRPATSTMPIDERPPPIRRVGTSLPPSSSFSSAAPTWNSSQGLYSSQVPPVSVSSSGRPDAFAAITPSGYPGEHVLALDRPSSALTASSVIAQHSSSDLASAANGTVDAPAPAYTYASASASAAATASTAPPLRHASIRPSPVSRSGSVPPPSQMRLIESELAHSGSSDTSLPSSSFPHSSSSPPPFLRPRRSSPDLMPPPPLPAVAVLKIPKLTGTTRATTAPSTIGSRAASQTNDTTGMVDCGAPVPDGSTSASGSARFGGLASTAILQRLRDSAGLYELEKDELEKVVAEVIREEGFAELLKALDGMWRAKGLVGVA
ncbi:hypothetical protein FKP32DRAFT_1630776 [Trametes sanguinea]|nr:hypothetical protein FKP32DRAFT_1630776 [Trametes sanguinea]